MLGFGNKYFFLFSFAIATTEMVAQPATVKQNSANSQTKSNVPTSIDRQFKRDAARLALRLDAEKEDVRYLPTNISRDNLTSLYKALCNIYLQDETGKSIARCNIHTFPNPSIDHLVVIYRRNIDWAAPLSKGITETTNRDFNKLLDQYDLAIERHVQWNDNQDAITLRSKEPLNMAAIAERFRDIQGVVQIDLGQAKFSGNDIRAKRVGGGWEIEFILAIGINQQHSWKFKATDNNQVSLLKESGTPLPAQMKCNLDDKNIVAKF
ncbi:MAG: hypothetical protein JNL70_07705 [Saprospiraceae bacterium]|nr:hypothetical protein [Saprospiraceae bacterium]